MQIHISKITHRDAQRLLVAIPYTNHNIQQIKQIPGATFSRTLNSWHIPFTKDAYSKLSTLFPHDEFIKAESTQPDDSKSDQSSTIVQSNLSEVPTASTMSPLPTEIMTSSTVIPESETKPIAENSENIQSSDMVPFPDTEYITKTKFIETESRETSSSSSHEIFSPPIFHHYANTSITLEVAARRLILRMPKNDTDVQFVLTFHFTVWNPGIKAWIIPNYKSNLDIIINYFGSRLTSVIRKPTTNHLLRVQKRVITLRGFIFELSASSCLEAARRA